ncbi:hypothetical protein BHE74_00042548 [Ensete ventricosum]|nr:hypothetical protein BHE74_00042548 [Ensete ventricosum]
MVRLGLRPETTKKSTPDSNKSTKSRGKKPCDKKRKFEEKKGNSSCKLRKKDSMKSKDLERLHESTLGSIDIEKFITTWKEFCREHSIAEAFTRGRFSLRGEKKHLLTWGDGTRRLPYRA